ncbi:MAG: hypothetical protein FWD97_07130 [Defluviitaleaceae bacterium]|nr:hypothetical protein [Defluviitaleaceae bacterium]
MQYHFQSEYPQLVGAGIARPTYADDTVQPQGIVPADMGRVMPDPTKYPPPL